MFDEGDVLSDTTLIQDARDLINQLWGMRPDTTYLPCTHPSSVMLADLHQLSRQPYWVGEKTDGERRFLLLGRTAHDGEHYALTVDRSYTLRRAPGFLSLDPPLDPTFFQGTLLDAELARSELVLFDTVAYKGYRYTQQKHTRRMRPLHEFERQVMARAATVATNTDDGRNGERRRIDRVRAKAWVPLGQAKDLWEQLRRRGHVVDGLILCPQFGFLKPGRHRTMFKWKPAEAHTVDFILSRRRSESPDVPASLLLAADGRIVRGDKVFPGLRLVCDADSAASVTCYAEAHRALPCVVECAVDPDTLVATIVRVRRDKTTPNDAAVARRTLRNRVEGIDVADLARYASAASACKFSTDPSEKKTCRT